MEYPFSSRPLPSLEENVEGCRGICAGIGTVLAEDAYATFAQEKQMNPRMRGRHTDRNRRLRGVSSVRWEGMEK